MLVLSRKPHEQVLIDEGRIIITVLEVRGNRVRLGIQAPEEVPIRRVEVELETPVPASETCVASGY